MSTPTGATQPPSIPQWTLGWRLRRAFDHAGMSGEEVARRLEMNPATVSRWANDHIRPRNIYLREIALACGVPYAWLVGEASDGPDTPAHSTSELTVTYASEMCDIADALRSASEVRVA